MMLVRFASTDRYNGMPTPEELEAEGYTRVCQHVLYSTSWLMVKEEPEESHTESRSERNPS